MNYEYRRKTSSSGRVLTNIARRMGGDSYFGFRKIGDGRCTMLQWLRNRRCQVPKRSLADIKQICNVLFIDDRKFEVVEILKKAGWIHTKRLRDLFSLDDKDIVDAHIVFVDIQGVGRALKCTDEGLGLIKAIKQKYPNKKVIVYSAEQQGNRFHAGLSIADARLWKNADPYEFQVLVERYSKETFSLDECVQRIQKILYQELGYRLEANEVIKGLTKAYKKKVFTVEGLSKIFNIRNAASIATIVKLFLMGE